MNCKTASFAARIIRMIMIYKGITTTQLAREIGITRPYLSLIIHGKKKTPHLRKKLAKALNLPPDFWENPHQVDFSSFFHLSQAQVTPKNPSKGEKNAS